MREDQEMAQNDRLCKILDKGTGKAGLPVEADAKRFVTRSRSKPKAMEPLTSARIVPPQMSQDRIVAPRERGPWEGRKQRPEPECLGIDYARD